MGNFYKDRARWAIVARLGKNNSASVSRRAAKVNTKDAMYSLRSFFASLREIFAPLRLCGG